MISRLDNPATTVDPVLAEHVFARVRACDAKDAVDPETLASLAHAVALFCMPSPRPGCVDSRLLDLALARALCAIGHTGCALAVLETSEGSARALSKYLPLVRQPEVPGVIWKVCASRTLRAGEWIGDPVDAAWVVDVRRVAAARDAGLEVVQFRLVRRLIELLAPVWDEGRGRGVLGLAGLAEPVEGGRGRRACAFADEWLHFARDVLEREKGARGWAETPRVVRFDLPVRGGKSRLAR